jgi:peptide/nickel transport system substrate-binding protein
MEEKMSKPNAASVYLLLALVASLVLAACGPTVAPSNAPQPTAIVQPTEPPQATESAKPTETVQAAPKVAVIIVTQEIDRLNHYYSNQWPSSFAQQIWNCWAWEYDDNNTAFPRLVKEMPSLENGGVSEDGLTITLRLRDDIVWSDGAPITSDDFAFTYEMVVEPTNSVMSQYPYDHLQGIETPDERTVVMKFAEPFAPWESTFWHGLMPAHVLRPIFEAEGTIDYAEWNKTPDVGCGPFVFAELESGSFMRFVRNKNYWLGQPKLDEIFLRFVPDDASQTAALLSNDADMGTFVPISDVPSLRDAGVQILTVASGYNEGWFFNLRDMANPAIKDVGVRKAIAMAFDREAINRDLLYGLTKPAVTFWDSLPTYVDPGLKPWPYDPEQSKQLLEEAGWTDTNGDGIREDAQGNKLSLKYGTTTREIRQDVQAVAQQQLLAVGVDVQLFNYQSDLFFGSLSDSSPVAMGQLDIMEWSDNPKFPDPDVEYWLCSQIPSSESPAGLNYFGCDPKLDQMFQDELKTIDTQARIKLFHDISRYIYEQVYWLGVWQDPDLWAVGSRLIAVKLSGVSPFYNIMDWDLAQ